MPVIYRFYRWNYINDKVLRREIGKQVHGIKKHPNTTLKHNADKLYKIKKYVNLILENGAYSNKNENEQMMKRGDNYNESEKTIVKAAWQYRKYLSGQMQEALVRMFNDDTDFLDELKLYAPDLYKSLMEMKPSAR